MLVRPSLALLLAFLFACMGCKGSEPPGEDAGLDAATEDATEAQDASVEDTSVPPPPTAQPPGVSFRDRDLRARVVTGDVVLTHAADERALDTYVLVYLDSSGVESAPIAEWPKATETMTHVFSETPLPVGATHLVAFSRGATGESARITLPLDNLVRHHGLLGPGEGAYQDLTASVLLPIAGSEKVLIVGTDPGRRMSVRRCNAAGTSCEELRVTGDSLNTNDIAAAITATTLYVVGVRGGEVRLFLCPAPTDAGPLGSCHEHALAGPASNNVAVTTSASRLYVVSDTQSGTATFTCPLAGPNEGTPCVEQTQALDVNSRLSVIATPTRFYVGGTDGLFDCAYDANARPMGCTARTIRANAEDFVLGASAMYVGHYGGDSPLTVCPLEAGGALSACAVPPVQPAGGFEIALHGGALYTVGFPGFFTNTVDRCSLDASGQPTTCTSITLDAADLTWPRSSLVRADALFAVERGHLLRCDLSAEGVVSGCTRRAVPVDPPGFDGAVTGTDADGDLFVARTRTLFSERSAIQVCPRLPEDSLGTCVVTPLTDDQSRFETPGIVLRGRSLYFARRASPGAHAVITHCDILEDLTLTACTETALEADDASYAYAPLRFEVADTLVALTTDDQGKARMLSCLLDANGAPTTQCSVASSDVNASAPASNVLVRGGLAYASVVNDQRSAVLACPVAGGVCTVASLPAYAVRPAEEVQLATDGAHLFAAHLPTMGEGVNAQMRLAVLACTLVDGLPTACAPHDLAPLQPRRGAAIFAEPGAIYVASVDGSTRVPYLLRCETENGVPGECESISMSADQGDHCAGFAGFDGFRDVWPERLWLTRAPSGLLLLATDNPSRRFRASVFTVYPY